VVLKNNYINRVLKIIHNKTSEETEVRIIAGHNTISITQNRIDVYLLGIYKGSVKIPVSLTIYGDQEKDDTKRILDFHLQEMKLDYTPVLTNPIDVIGMYDQKFDSALMFREIRNYKLMNAC